MGNSIRFVLLNLAVLGLVNWRALAADLRLVEAVQKQDKDAIRSLLKGPIDVNASQPDGATALAWAAHWNDLETARLLFGAGADANIANEYGITPLSLACTNASAPMVEVLLKGGGNPNVAQPRTAETILMTCALTGNADAVKLLLAKGANVDAKESKRGQTSLMWAAEHKHYEVAKALVEQGANVTMRSSTGFTPLLFAARQGDIDTARLLLEAGADPNDAVPDGLNALLLSIDSGHESFPIFLLEKGANPNSADQYGMTALHYALRKGITILQGTHFEAVDPVFSHYWFRTNMPKLVNSLLSRGANPNARIGKQLSLTNGSHRHHHYLSLVGATPFLLAATSNDVPIMKALIAAGADPLIETADGTTAAMVAAGLGRDDFDDKNRSGEDEKAALDSLKLAVELGGDVNGVNQYGSRAIHGAAFTGANEIVKFLVEQGAKIQVKDIFGQTPLSIAEGDPNGLVDDRERHKHESTAKLIKEMGGDPLAVLAIAHPAQ